MEQIPPPLESSIDFKQIISIILHRKWLIISVALIAFIAGCIFVKLRTPIYASNMLMQVSSQGTGGSSNTNIIMLADSGTSAAATEAKIIPSRSVLTQVVKSLHLDTIVSAKYFPFIGHMKARKYAALNLNDEPAAPYLGLSTYDWGGNSIDIKDFEVSPRLIGQSFMIKVLSDKTYQLLMNGRKLLTKGKVEQDINVPINKYEKITLDVDHIHANKDVEFYVTKVRAVDSARSIASNLTVASSSQDLLNLTYNGTSPQLAAKILNTIGNAAITNQITGQARQASKILSFLSSQLPKAKESLLKAEEAQNAYRTDNNGFDLTTKAQNLMENISKLDGQIAQLQMNLAGLQEQYTSQSYQVKNAKAVIDRLQGYKQTLIAKLKVLPKAQQEQVNLLRDTKLQSTLYTSILKNIQQYQLMKAGVIGSLHIIDEASTQLYPIGASGKIIVTLFVLIGIILSLIYIAIEAYFITGITDPETIEEKFNLPILASVHESKHQRMQAKKFKNNEISHLQMIAEIDAQDIAAESFKSLRTYLLFDLPDATNNIIGIYGPTPNLGKSFISANLAHALSLVGKSVLLIDGDIRRGSLHNYFNNKHEQGLAEIILGKNKLEECIVKTRFEHLDFLPRGSICADHVELLMRTGTKSVLNEVSKVYDYVVIDTAPILAISDSMLIAPHVGTNIVLFGYGKHDKHEIQVTLERFKKASIKTKGFIFNRIKASYSYYGSKYNYRYSYKSK